MNQSVADQRVLVGVDATLTFQALNGDGNESDPGVVTVAVTDSDGGVLLPAGTATAGTGDNPRTVVLPAVKNTRLDLLTATWTAASGARVTQVDVCGGFYFSEAEARASDATLADYTKYPTVDILTARREVEDEFERICQVAFVPRYTRETVDSPGTCRLVVHGRMLRHIRSVGYYSTPGVFVAYDTDQLDALAGSNAGVIEQRFGMSFVSGRQTVVVGYEHGFDRVPSEVKRAALTRLRQRLNFAKSGIPDRATNFIAAEGGTFALSTAGVDKTGVDVVDAVLDRYSMRVPGVA